jgi:hypothetical protein
MFERSKADSGHWPLRCREYALAAAAAQRAHPGQLLPFTYAFGKSLKLPFVG